MWIEADEKVVGQVRVLLEEWWRHPTDECGSALAFRVKELLGNVGDEPALVRVFGYDNGGGMTVVDDPAVYEAEGYTVDAGLRCPHCGAVAWDDYDSGVRVVDVAVRWHSFGYDHDRSVITGSYDNDGDYETDHYECESCGGRVSLPDGVTEEGS